MNALAAIASTVLLGVSSPASAVVMDPVFFDLSGGGDLGPAGTLGGSDCTVSTPASCRSHTDSVSRLTLTLGSLTMIPDVRDALNGGTPGGVFIDFQGAGVKASATDGSKEISGEGGHQDEALQFALSMPVVTDTVVITLTRFGGDKASKKSSSKSKNPGKQRDRTVVYINDSSMPTLGLLGMGMLGVGLAPTRRSRSRFDPTTLRSAPRDPSSCRH